MTWTSEPPTSPCQVWHRKTPDSDPFVVTLTMIDGVVGVPAFGKYWVPAKQIGGEWHPLTPPPTPPAAGEAERVAKELYDDLRDYPPKERSNWEAVVAAALTAAYDRGRRAERERWALQAETEANRWLAFAAAMVGPLEQDARALRYAESRILREFAAATP